MQIRTVEFSTSALDASAVPRPWFPHVAVAGRSNVGKSSLLNWLLRRTVARVAKTPGKTRTLNFFLINGNLYLVDLPGYGYAKVGRKLQQEWGRELTRYLAEEPRLAGVVALVDVRHGLTALDLQLQQLIAESGLERVVVLTKGDKVKRGKRKEMQYAVQRQLALPTPPVVSSVTSGEGRKDVLDAIEALASQWKAQQQETPHGAQEKELN
jgi:GTP-binding protein